MVMTALIWSDEILGPQAQTAPIPKGWRVPTRTELVELFDSGDFPEEMRGKSFWSSTPYAPNPAGAWIVIFNVGNALASNTADPSYVRLVRDVESDIAPDAKVTRAREINDGGPVHPTTEQHGFNSGMPGMTLRQHYAGLAMQGELAAFHRADGEVAGLSFDVTDDQPKNQCWCETCRPITMDDMRMVLCPECGNKRCPKATSHANACTGSNEAGQKGSSWERVNPSKQVLEKIEPLTAVQEDAINTLRAAIAEAEKQEPFGYVADGGYGDLLIHRIRRQEILDAGLHEGSAMNTPTEVFVNIIRDTTHGSDWYGLCEVCKQDVSRTSQLQKHRVWVKDSGVRYLSPMGGGAYGHAGCLIKVFGDALAKSQFLRVDGYLTVTDEQLDAMTKKELI